VKMHSTPNTVLVPQLGVGSRSSPSPSSGPSLGPEVFTGENPSSGSTRRFGCAAVAGVCSNAKVRLGCGSPVEGTR
jgi:hypothetical protein